MSRCCRSLKRYRHALWKRVPFFDPETRTMTKRWELYVHRRRYWTRRGAERDIARFVRVCELRQGAPVVDEIHLAVEDWEIRTCRAPVTFLGDER